MIRLPHSLAAIAVEKQAENDEFRLFLKGGDGTELDEIVQRLDREISPLIDCTACGNCCKTLMIVVTDQEADRLAGRLQMPRDAFDGSYLEKGSQGMMIVNRMPCHFLADNKCTVYEDRFAGCREFPALHVAGFRERLFTTFMHYDRCPIIYNVIERLKQELHFLPAE